MALRGTSLGSLPTISAPSAMFAAGAAAAIAVTVHLTVSPGASQAEAREYGTLAGQAAASAISRELEDRRSRALRASGNVTL